MPGRRPFAGVLGTADGPAADATVLEIDRPSPAAFGCAGLTALFLAAITVSALALAFSEIAAVNRILTGAFGVCAILLLAVVLTAWASIIRQAAGLAFDAAGLWWTDRNGLICLPWNEFSSARVVAATGPKRAPSGAPQLELMPNDVQRFFEHEALREKLVATEPDGDEKPRLRLSFALTGDPARRSAEQALHRFAPHLAA